MTNHYTAIIPHPTEPKMLVTHVSDAWVLPSLPVSSEFFAYVMAITDQIQKQYGIATTVLRCAARHYQGEGEERVVHDIFVCENLGQETTPPQDCRWMGREELDTVAITLPPFRATLEKWFAEAENPALVSPLRPGWARNGWLTETTEWIYRTLATRGITPIGPIEQLKTWSISYLLRLPTTAGNVYFKAVSSVFAMEPRLTAAVAELFPGQTAEVLAIDEARNCMLLRELSGCSLRDASKQEPEADLYATVLRRFSAIQIACIGQEDSLTKWGCRSRPLSQLPDDITELLAELENGEMRSIYGLTEEEATALVKDIPTKVTALCAELASFDLPETLLHGDLHGGNIWVTGEGDDRCFFFFDWSDGAIAHPFFDLVTFLGTPDASDEATMDRYAQSRDAYLDAWTVYLPRDQLVSAFSVAQKLAPAYHAISYRLIAQDTEPASQWELSPAVGYYLKNIANQ